MFSEEEIASPSSELAERRSQPVGQYVFTDSWSHSPTEAYNFGKCMMTGTSCHNDEVECCTSLSNVYLPSQCSLADINNPQDVESYQHTSEVCMVVCGDGECDQGENRLDGPVYCAEDCSRRR
jgi:hypothetical protein